MVSSGTPWKETGTARAAGLTSLYLSEGVDRAGAFELTRPVAIEDLASNTPFVSYIVRPDRSVTARFGFGFAVSEGSLELARGGEIMQGFNELARIERRGDTVVVQDEAAAAELMDDFLSGSEFLLTARSKKTFDKEEHYLTYRFRGRDDRAALETCLTEVSQGAYPAASHAPSFSLSPATDVTGAERVAVRAMACNRDLDPNGAELMRVDGAIGGFASPLAHALVQRDTNGELVHAWSGDLWRISRTEDGYSISVSNSILAQSPLDAQEIKACTRFAAPRCATLESKNDQYIVGACFDDYLAQAGIDPEFVPLANWTRPTGLQLASATTPSRSVAAGGGSGGGGGGGGAIGGGGGGGASATAAAAEDPESVTTFSVVNGTPNGTDTPTQQQPAGQTDVAAIPLPGSLAFFAAFLLFPLIWGFRRAV